MEKEKKQKLEMIALAVLLVVFVLVAARAVIRIKSSLAKIKKAKTAVTATAAPQAQATATPVQGAAVVQTQQATGQSSWGVDPFSGRQIYVSQENGAELRLSGIVYSAEKPETSYAIINNSIVCVGQNLEGTKIKVKDISKDEVTIADGAKEMKLKVW